MTGPEYLSKRKFGRLKKPTAEDSDSDEEYPGLVDKTPNTKRRIREEIIKVDIKKLTTLQTFFTLFKGFVCTGIIYAPKAFVNGGYVWTSIILATSGLFTCICALKLLEVKKKTGMSNFSEIG